jgi:hypothetical protein
MHSHPGGDASLGLNLTARRLIQEEFNGAAPGLKLLEPARILDGLFVDLWPLFQAEVSTIYGV